MAIPGARQYLLADKRTTQLKCSNTQQFGHHNLHPVRSRAPASLLKDGSLAIFVRHHSSMACWMCRFLLLKQGMAVSATINPTTMSHLSQHAGFCPTFGHAPEKELPPGFSKTALAACCQNTRHSLQSRRCKHMDCQVLRLAAALLRRSGAGRVPAAVFWDIFLRLDPVKPQHAWEPGSAVFLEFPLLLLLLLFVASASRPAGSRALGPVERVRKGLQPSAASMASTVYTLALPTYEIRSEHMCFCVPQWPMGPRKQHNSCSF